MSHTPGPWHVDDDSVWAPSRRGGGGRNVPSRRGGGGRNIATVESRREAWPANARLIAAAPDLLEALKGAMEFLDMAEGAEAAAAAFTAAVALAKAERGS
jgi:hypothetical protein